MELNYVEYHRCVCLFSSVPETSFAYILSFYERVTWFCVYHDRPMHWRNDTQKKGLAFEKLCFMYCKGKFTSYNKAYLV